MHFKKISLLKETLYRDKIFILKKGTVIIFKRKIKGNFRMILINNLSISDETLNKTNTLFTYQY